MPKMEENLGSGDVVKKKSSSGCLIIKKKGDFSGGGVGSSQKVKNNSRTITGEFGSSDDSLDYPRGDVSSKVPNEPIVYSRRENREFGGNGEITERDMKRSRMDLFEFDEYDEFDMKRMRNDFMEMVGRSGSSREFGSGSRAVMVEKRKQAYFDASGRGTSGKSKTTDYGGKRRYDSDEDEANMPLSALRLKNEGSAGAIRLQGKSGVLKVMVNKKKKMDLPSVEKFDHQRVEKRKRFDSEDAIKREFPVSPPVSSDFQRKEKRAGMLDGKETLQELKLGKHKKSENRDKGRTDLKLQKSQLSKSKIAGKGKSDWTERSSKVAPPSLAGNVSMKSAKREEKISSLPENVTPIKVRERKVTITADDESPKEEKEGKPKRGGSTEKQILREKIREMLIKAGWKIDYRPRKDRDYLDAVYINPSGTAYWSIVKAYDAFQKQMPESDNVVQSGGKSSPFAPLSEDLIKKLTRKTRKKMEEELRQKGAGKKGGSSGMKKSKKAVSNVSNEESDDNQSKERLNSLIRQNGKAKNSRLHEEDSDGGHEQSDDSLEEECEVDDSERRSTISSVVQARKSKKIGRCTVLARNSEDLESDGYVPYAGKRTLLAWLVDLETVRLSEKVQYMNRRRTRAKLDGWITREGIHCGCCSKILSVSKFELHAGSKLRQPFQSIILESGLSLLECLIDAWNKQDESLRKDFYLVDVDGGDPDDDTCGICADGGDLICCDGCPSTFHQSCLGIQMLPPGDWHCPNCTCKFCGMSGENVSEEDTDTASELLTCNLCEKKYHISCSKGMDAPFQTSESPSLYCGRNCQEIHDHLQKILGVKHELEAGFSWSLLHRMDINSDTENRGYPQRVECNSKLTIALSVMDECFLPIIDRRSGINQIHNVVYNCGSNFNRLNYRGFYTVVLERGDEIISAASIRADVKQNISASSPRTQDSAGCRRYQSACLTILECFRVSSWPSLCLHSNRLRGTQLAEMPFIGTRHMYRRQGMCRRLLFAIESVLSSLRIEKLTIPAISEHMQTWTGVFGFKPLEDSQRKAMKLLNMLVFPGADMLQKPLLKPEISENVEDTMSNDNSPQSHNLVEASDLDSLRKETKMQVDIASDEMSGEPQIDGNIIQNEGQGNSSVVGAKINLQDPVETSCDAGMERDGNSLKLSNGVVPEAVEDSASIEQKDRSSAEASPSNAAQQAPMESAYVSPGDEPQIDGNSIQNGGQGTSSGVEAKIKLEEPAETSCDAGGMLMECDETSLKLSNEEVPEAVEDSASIEQKHKSSAEASPSNAAQQAPMESASVSSPFNNTGDIVSQFSSDLNQDNSIDVEVGDGSDKATCDLSMEASVQTVAEESRKDIDPCSYSALQYSDGKAAISNSHSDVEKMADVRNEISTASVLDFRVNFDDQATRDPSTDASVQNVAEESRKEMDPCFEAALQCSDGKAATSNSLSDVENVADVRNELSTGLDLDSRVKSDDPETNKSSIGENALVVNKEESVLEHPLDLSPKKLVADEADDTQKTVAQACLEGDKSLSVSVSGDLKEQSSTVDMADVSYELSTASGLDSEVKSDDPDLNKSSTGENALVVNTQESILEHPLDSSPGKLVADETDGTQKTVAQACLEIDRTLSMGVRGDLKEQSSTVEVISIEASENVCQAAADITPLVDLK